MKIDKEFQSLIPALSVEEFSQLEASITKEGCRDALMVWDDTLVDGHNRYKICEKNNVKFKIKEKKFKDKEEAKEWIIKNQFARRNLSTLDRIDLADKLRNIISEKAKEKQSEAGKLKTESSKASINTNKEIAKIARVGETKMKQYKKIKDIMNEEQRDEINAGTNSINKIYQDIRREEKLKVVNEKVKEFKGRKQKDSFVDIFKTKNKYNIILADPSWSYFTSGNKNQSLHYQGMTIEEISALPVERIADENCILFIWVTFPILDRAFEVIKAWGFDYSTCGFNWIKKNKNKDSNFIGLGSWTRSNSELCLIATKGKTERLDKSISQIIETPIEEHSRKPDIVREKITTLVGELPRIELFSRQSIKGWDYWGNDINLTN